MKTKIHLLLIVTAAAIAGIAHVRAETFCATSPTASVRGFDDIGGIYMTSGYPDAATVRVLVVFASFPDDNDPSDIWPVGGCPNFMDTFIDQTADQNSTNYANLTHYFSTMSFDKLTIIGEAKCVVADNNQGYYSGRGAATRHILEKLDLSFDYSDYDKWERTAYYTHVNNADGLVDMIIVAWRSKYWGGWSGIASLGGGPEFPVDGGQRTIRMGYPSGSGVTVQGGTKGAAHALVAAKHELGHWLIGSRHPYSSGKYSFWGIMGRWYEDNSCANAYEREILGWIDGHPITGDLSNVALSDFVTTGKAYRYHPPNGYSNEWYFFENHQKSDLTYDDATVNTEDKGILILHMKNFYDGTNGVRTKTSDGYWDWENPYWIDNPWGEGTIPVYDYGQMNINGLNHREIIPHSQGGSEWILAMPDGSGGTLTGSFYKGKYLEGSFNSNTSDVFAIWSNPNTDTWSGIPANFSMKVIGQNGSDIYVNFSTASRQSGSLQATAFNGARKLVKNADNLYLVYESGNQIYFISLRITVILGTIS